MATSRYISRKFISNNSDLYQNKFFDKGVKKFVHYDSPTFIYPSEEKIQGLDILSHIWKQGDSYEKISFAYYNDSNYWWVIAMFNQKPTEQTISVGDIIYIPLPLYKILTILGY